MTGDELKAWRRSLGLSQAAAASLLELSRNWYAQLEAGIRQDTHGPAIIPRNVARACGWIAETGDRDYRGPQNAK